MQHLRFQGSFLGQPGGIRPAPDHLTWSFNYAPSQKGFGTPTASRTVKFKVCTQNHINLKPIQKDARPIGANIRPHTLTEQFTVYPPHWCYMLPLTHLTYINHPHSHRLVRKGVLSGDACRLLLDISNMSIGNDVQMISRFA